MTQVRAKFQCTEVQEVGGVVKFCTLYDDSIPEDVKFSQATPWGELEMGIDNKDALNKFEVGKSYYVDFTPAD